MTLGQIISFQGYPRLLIMAVIKSLYTVVYYWSIVVVDLSNTILDVWQLKDQKLVCYLPHLDLCLHSR